MKTMSNSQKYDKVVVFSGGGTRFGIYCGMYAALEDSGCAPDLIIGVCGGAIATNIINSFSTNIERKNYLKSEELYRFIKTTKLTEERKLSKIGLLCLDKIVNKKNAPYIEDVFNRYLVDMPETISAQLPTLTSEFGKNVKSIIVASKVLFDTTEIGNKRASDRKLYYKVLFTDKDTARTIRLEDIGIQSENYKSSAVDSSIEIMTDIPMQTATRISLSDMFYVPPVNYKGNYFTGGAVDLIPIELAKHVGKYVIFEKKRGYSVLEEALVRAVLGYSGNKRLKETEMCEVDKWIDTRNVSKDLNGHYCRKNIDWLRLQVSISLPESYGQFAEDMNAQWDYGYKCVTKAGGR